MIKKNSYLAPGHKRLIIGALLTAFSFESNAAPTTLNLTGTVTDASGTRIAAGDLGSGVTTNLVIDLDPANVAVYEPVDSATAIWYFSGAPYNGESSGNFGTINASILFIETFDNLDADAFGNPFGLTGVVDVLSIFGSDDRVDCTGGIVDPITGCSLDNAPVISGEEFSVNLIYNNLWFSGAGENDLPGSLPDFAELIGIFGNTTFASGGAFVGENEVTYKPLSVSAVPIPAAIWLFGTALIGLVGFGKRRRSA